MALYMDRRGMQRLGPSEEARARSAATRRRRADERLAEQLRSRGWTCEPPEDTEPTP